MNLGQIKKNLISLKVRVFFITCLNLWLDGESPKLLKLGGLMKIGLYSELLDKILRREKK